jgi:hypothetical protein
VAADRLDQRHGGRGRGADPSSAKRRMIRSPKETAPKALEGRPGSRRRSRRHRAQSARSAPEGFRAAQTALKGGHRSRSAGAAAGGARTWRPAPAPAGWGRHGRGRSGATVPAALRGPLTAPASRTEPRP